MSSDDLYENQKWKTFIFWLALWAATLYHAGLTVWAMLLTTHFPPGYGIPPTWTNFFSPGPTSQSLLIYLVVLGVNLYWECAFKGQKTYKKPEFPFPDLLYGHIAMILWSVLWLFGHLGSDNGWFTYPNELGITFGTCLFLGLYQHAVIRTKRNPEEFEDIPNAGIEATSRDAGRSDTGSNVNKNRYSTSEAPQPKAQVVHPYPLSSDDEEITRKLLEYVHQNGQAKTGVLVGVLGSPRRTVIRTLNKLIADGRLVREGSGSGAVYRLNTSTKEDRFN